MNPPIDILEVAAQRVAEAKAAYDATKYMHGPGTYEASTIAWAEFTQAMFDFHAAEDLSRTPIGIR